MRSRSSGWMSRTGGRAGKRCSTRRSADFPLRSLDDLPAGEYRVQAVLNRYEKFTRSDGWTLMLPPDQRRRPGVAPEARQPLLETRDGPRRTETSRPCRPGARPGHPAGRGIREQADEVRASFQHPQRAAFEVLGTRRVPRSLGAAALGIRRAPGCPLSARHRARPLSCGARRFPRNAAGPGSQAGLQQAIPARRLQPHPAGVRLAGAPGLDHARVSPRVAGRDPAPDAVITTIRTR